MCKRGATEKPKEKDVVPNTLGALWEPREQDNAHGNVMGTSGTRKHLENTMGARELQHGALKRSMEAHV
jgi:hypothetical protein